MIELHELIYSDAVFRRDELRTGEGTIIFHGGMDAYYEDICKTISPLSDEMNFKDNKGDKNVSLFQADILTFFYHFFSFFSVLLRQSR